MGRWQTAAVRVYHSTFNMSFAIISALFNGVVAAGVNWEYGLAEAVWAAFAQAGSSFFSTGLTARVVQHFSPVKNLWISYPLGSIVPATMTFLMSFIAHIWNGSPELWNSLVTPVAVSFTTSFITNWITRNPGRSKLLRGLRPRNYPNDEGQA